MTGYFENKSANYFEDDPRCFLTNTSPFFVFLKVNNMQLANKLIQNLQDISDEKQIREFLLQLIDTLQLEYFLLGVSFPLSMSKSDSLLIDNYPDGWVKYYEDQELVSIDPVAIHCAKYNSAVFWADLKDPQMQLFKKMEEEFFPGAHLGFSIPLHGPQATFGLLSLSLCSDKQNGRKKLENALTLAQILSPHLLDVVARLRDKREIKKIQLTTREVECLTWATEGKSAWEISQILNCSERTVTFHLVNATSKLNCTNRYQAIGKAIITGVIKPQLF